MRCIDDTTWAVLTIWMEARGESDDGKQAVAEVIRNRTQARYNSDGTVSGTVLRAFQFSCWNTSDPNRLAAAKLDEEHPLVEACLDAWRRAEGGSNLVKGAVLYYAGHTKPIWAGLTTPVVTIGRHHFYADPR